MEPVDELDPAARLLILLRKAAREAPHHARQLAVIAAHKTVCRLGWAGEAMDSLSRGMLRDAAMVAAGGNLRQAISLASEASWRAACRKGWDGP